MKKLIACAMMAALVSGAVWAEVYSQNAVGYVRIEVPAGGLDMVSTPFLNIDGTDQTLGEIFPDVPDLSLVFVYDAEDTQQYKGYRFFEGAGWFDPDDDFAPADDVVIPRGQGVWFRNAAATDFVNFIMGEVPGVTAFPEENITIFPGLNMITVAYPVEIDLEKLTEQLESTDLDMIFKWNAEGGSYIAARYFEGAGWFDPDNDFEPSTITIAPGQAVWYRSGADVPISWTNEPGYDWPQN